MGRNSVAGAAATRERIIAAAVARASAVGLEQVSVRDLADDLGMSKSGVAGPFGSRDELVAAAFGNAMGIFRASVVRPVLDEPAGPERLQTLIDRWCGYLEDCPFPGGCMITTASVEFDNLPGEMRERVAETVQTWRGFLLDQVRKCCPGIGDDRGEVVVTMLTGIAMAANQEIQLLGDATAGERARECMRQAVQAAS